MTKIGSWSANIPSLAPCLATASRGETLKLRPSGSWTAIHANELEGLSDVALPKLQQATTLKIDMTEVRELDTLGAWLLENCYDAHRSPAGQETSPSWRVRETGPTGDPASTVEAQALPSFIPDPHAESVGFLRYRCRSVSLLLCG